MIKLVNIRDKISKKKRDTSAVKKKNNSKINSMRAEIRKLTFQIQGLSQSLDTINNMYLESAKASVDLLSELDYNKYKASYMDYYIKHTSSYEKLKKYIQIVTKFFIQEIKCCYISFTYTGTNKRIKDILTKKASKNHSRIPGFLQDRCNGYNTMLVDILYPERTIGKITIGKEPYKDARKEKDFDKKIKKELYYIKRVLENLISEIHNKELAVKDALTELYNRKYLEEKLWEHFNSVDLFSSLDGAERRVLDMIIESESKPYNLLRDEFFQVNKSKDEEALVRAIQGLLDRHMIGTRKEIYLGQLTDYYHFISSKKDYNLFVAMFDLDHFKDVNDNWGGHAVGDQILINFSSILKKYIRTTDIAVRHGGEEFIIIFNRAVSMLKIKEILEKIRTICESSLIVKHRERTRNVTVSIGLTRISKYDKNINQIIARVDKALYMAKKVRNKLVIIEEDHNGYRRVDV